MATTTPPPATTPTPDAATPADGPVTTLTIPAKPLAVTVGNVAALTAAGAVAAPVAAAITAGAVALTAGAVAARRLRRTGTTTDTEKTTVTKTTGGSGTGGGGVLSGLGRATRTPGGRTPGGSTTGHPSGRTGRSRTPSTGHLSGTTGRTPHGRTPGNRTGGSRTPGSRTPLGQGVRKLLGQATGRTPRPDTPGTGHPGRTGHHRRGRTTTRGRTPANRTGTTRTGRTAGILESALAGFRKKTARAAGRAALTHARTTGTRHPLIAAAAAAAARAIGNAHRRARHRTLAAHGRRPDGTPVPPPGTRPPCPNTTSATRAATAPRTTPIRTHRRNQPMSDTNPTTPGTGVPAAGSTAGTGGSAMLAMIKDAASRVIAAPRANMLETAAECHDMPQILMTLCGIFAARAQQIRDNEPAHAAIPHHYTLLAGMLATAAGQSRQIGAAMEGAHTVELARLRAPRNGEHRWDLTANQQR